MLELIKLRSQIVSGNLPVDEMKDIKMKATSEIDTGNKLLGKVATYVKIMMIERGCDIMRCEIIFINLNLHEH